MSPRVCTVKLILLLTCFYFRTLNAQRCSGVNLHLFSLSVPAACVLLSLALMQVSGSIFFSHSLMFHSSSSFCLVCISPALPLRVSFSLSISRGWEPCVSALTLDLPSSPVNSVSLAVSLLPISHSHSPTNSLELYWHTRWIVLPSHYSLKLNEDATLKYAFSLFPSSLLLSKASISFHINLICPFLCCVI